MKNRVCQQSSKGQKKAPTGPITIGMDLGDKTSRYCVLNKKRRSGARAHCGYDEERDDSGVWRPAWLPHCDGSGPKEGDRYLRQLLVQGAHGILRHSGPDTDLT